MPTKKSKHDTKPAEITDGANAEILLLRPSSKCPASKNPKDRKPGKLLGWAKTHKVKATVPKIQDQQICLNYIFKGASCSGKYIQGERVGDCDRLHVDITDKAKWPPKKLKKLHEAVVSSDGLGAIFSSTTEFDQYMGEKRSSNTKKKEKSEEDNTESPAREDSDTDDKSSSDEG